MSEEKKVLREAVALEYTINDTAPRVIATGKGAVAEAIVARAQEHDIPIHEDPELAHALNHLKLGSEIPPELYTVVAQVLLYVSDMDKKLNAAL